MRDKFVTAFWRSAYESLPADVRARYLAQMQAAESWELTLQAAIQAWSRAKSAVAKFLQAPSRAH